MARSRKYDGDEIVRLRKGGKSYKEIAKALKCNPSTLTPYLRAAGLIQPGIGRPRHAPQPGGVITEVMRAKAVKMAFQSPKVVRAIFEAAQGFGQLCGIWAPRNENETSKILEDLK